MTNPYPAAAGDGASAHAPSAVAPSEVQNAFRLYIASTVLGLIGSVLQFFGQSSAFDAAIKQQSAASGVSEEQLRSAVQGVGYSVIIVAVVFLALYLFFVFKMRAGRNWARIVLTVLSVLSIIGGVIGIGATFALGGIGVVAGLLTLVQVVLLAAAVFFMFRPVSNACFSSARPV